jgi:hypothetical protein
MMLNSFSTSPIICNDKITDTKKDNKSNTKKSNEDINKETNNQDNNNRRKWFNDTEWRYIKIGIFCILAFILIPPLIGLISSILFLAYIGCTLYVIIEGYRQ